MANKFGLLESTLTPPDMESVSLEPSEAEEEETAAPAVEQEQSLGTAADLVKEAYAEHPDEQLRIELADMMQTLAASEFPQAQPGTNQSMQRMADAEHTGAGMRLVAGLTGGIGKMIQGATGADQTAGPSGQALQQMNEASYAPRKMAQQADMIEASELEETSKRRQLEMQDPTSKINRDFQAKLSPMLEKLGVKGLQDYITIDKFKPGQLLHTLRDAKRKSEFQQRSAMLQAATSDLEYNRASVEKAKDRQAMLQKAAMAAEAKVRAKRGSGGGGGGGSTLGASSEEDYRKLYKDMTGVEPTDAQVSAFNRSKRTTKDQVVKSMMDPTKMADRIAEQNEAAQEAQEVTMSTGQVRAGNQIQKAADNLQSVAEYHKTLTRFDSLLNSLPPREAEIALSKLTEELPPGAFNQKQMNLRTTAKTLLHLRTKFLTGVQGSFKEMESIANSLALGNKIPNIKDLRQVSTNMMTGVKKDIRNLTAGLMATRPDLLMDIIKDSPHGWYKGEVSKKMKELGLDKSPEGPKEGSDKASSTIRRVKAPDGTIFEGTEEEIAEFKRNYKAKKK